MPGNVLLEDQYSAWTGLIYVFNLIVGTGALTLPAVFNNAGWALGLTLICVLAFISFVTVTFVIEAMASANAVFQWRKLQQLKRVSVTIRASLQNECREDDDDTSNEDSPLVTREYMDRFPPQPQSFFAIREKFEMGQMATLFFSRVGRTLFYVCFVVYLYGDLSIYSAAVAKSLGDVACTYRPANSSCNDTIPDSDFCWDGSEITRFNAYRIFLAMFALALGPFAFFNVQKTKYLQIITSLMRWFAFSFMIAFAARKLIVDGPQGHPPVADIAGIPSLFGACVYSFMCHHSLPALVSPIADKSRLSHFLAMDYIAIAAFYLLLAMTGAFAFKHLDDLYTLDFSPRGSGDCDMDLGITMEIIDYFLALFPVFTLSTSFPIIAITLRNNLQALFLTEGHRYRWCTRKMLFPMMAIVPPIMIAMVTKDLKILVGVTGSYAGTGIQYIIPAVLVHSARKETLRVFGVGVKNSFASPFYSRWWVIFVVIWAVACVALVTVNFAQKLF